jgi:hypothetical protein
LLSLFAWLDLPADRDLCELAVERCRLDKLRKGVSGDNSPIPNRTSPDGFFRRGVVGGWRDELAPWKVRVIEDVCGSLMEDLGYELVAPATSAPLARARRSLHDALERLHGGLDWRLRRLIKRI